MRAFVQVYLDVCFRFKYLRARRDHRLGRSNFLILGDYVKLQSPAELELVPCAKTKFRVF